MATTATQWRIAYLRKGKMSLAHYPWSGSDEEKAEFKRVQREFTNGLVEFMRINGYSGMIITPFGAIKVEAEA